MPKLRKNSDIDKFDYCSAELASKNFQPYCHLSIEPTNKNRLHVILLFALQVNFKFQESPICFYVIGIRFYTLFDLDESQKIVICEIIGTASLTSQFMLSF